MIAAVIAVVIDFLFGQFLFDRGAISGTLFASAVVGVVVVVVIERVADYFTSYLFTTRPADSRGEPDGAATNFLAGFSTGLQSTAPSAIVLVVAILVSYYLGYYGSGSITLLMGVYSTAIATMSMLSLTGMIMSIDSFGPITDNANGIAEMAGLEGSVRDVTDELDAVGNTTKATTKAFAVMSAALAAVSIFEAFQSEVNRQISAPRPLRQVRAGSRRHADLHAHRPPRHRRPLHREASCRSTSRSFLIQAVGRAAIKMVNEVRRQFREIPGIMEGTGKPDYAKCVDISTQPPP